MDTTLADIGRSRSTWTDAQRTALRAAFTAIRDFFKEAFILRGKRATVAVDNFSGSTDIVVECQFVPRSVTVLDVVASDGFHYTSSYRWSWDNGFVRMTEYAGFLPTGGVLTFDVFIERA